MTLKKLHFRKNVLALSFLMIIILIISFNTFTTRSLIKLGDLTKMINKHPIVVSNASLTAALYITKMHRNMKDAVLSVSKENLEAVVELVADNEQEVIKQLNIIRDAILGDEGKALEKETRQLFIEWRPIRYKVIQLMKSHEIEKAVKITQKEGAVHVDKLEKKMLELTNYARNKANMFHSQAETSQSKLEIVSISLTVTGVLLSLIIAFTAINIVNKSYSALLEERNKLAKALDEIKTLQGIIPICSFCKKIRNDDGVWNQLEEYISVHSEAKFSHGVCPACVEQHYPEFHNKHK